MDKQLIKVGISCGNTNDFVFKQIFHVFNKPQMFDFCIPIIYSCSTSQTYCFRTKKDPYVRTINISNANESVKNNLNIILQKDKSTSIKSEKTIIKNIIIDKSVQKGLADLKAGKIDVFVIPSIFPAFKQITLELSTYKNSLPILVRDYFCIVEVFEPISVKILIEKIKILHSVLISDFIFTFPRIAVLSIKSSTKIISDAVQFVFQRGIFCFEAFDIETFFNSGIYKKFNAAIITMDCNNSSFPFKSVSHILPINSESNVIFIGNIPNVLAISDCDMLLSAIYLVVDIYRCRKTRLFSSF